MGVLFLQWEREPIALAGQSHLDGRNLRAWQILGEGPGWSMLRFRCVRSGRWRLSCARPQGGFRDDELK